MCHLLRIGFNTFTKNKVILDIIIIMCELLISNEDNFPHHFIYEEIRVKTNYTILKFQRNFQPLFRAKF